MKPTAENSKGEKMKYRLARSMKECMKTMSVDNITVKQITENCGVTRQTFYRNFMDKFDLINWYFDKLLAKSFEHMGMGKTVYDALVKKFTYIQEEHVFFAAAFKYDSQNSLTGNCYGIASSVAAIAKELGYEPYVITIPDGHSFVMINGLYYDNMYGTLFGAATRPAYTIEHKIKF